MGTLTTGSVADAIGRQKTLFYGQIIATVFFLLQLAVTNVTGLALIRFCLGPLYLLIYGWVSVRDWAQSEMSELVLASYILPKWWIPTRVQDKLQYFYSWMDPVSWFTVLLDTSLETGGRAKTQPRWPVKIPWFRHFGIMESFLTVPYYFLFLEILL